MPYHTKQGFTLIELSIVLVIIGLIVGGVLVGRDLIRASEIRAQISQIQEYQAAVNTFRGKYNELPGDISAAAVARFGFTVVPTRPGLTARADGNGAIEGWWFYGNGVANGITNGEAAWFWQDLSVNGGGLIDGSFTTATASGIVADVSANKYIPTAKMGDSNYVYVYTKDNVNYFGVSSVQSSGLGSSGEIYGATSPGMTVAQAYGIDKKMDDGMPQSGTVTARYQNWGVACATSGCEYIWAAGNSQPGANSGNGPTTAATLAASYTCYDNNNVAGANQQYSMTTNNGAGNNCGLSFKFQ